MTSPWDYVHAPGNNGVTLYQTRWSSASNNGSNTSVNPATNLLVATPLASGGALRIAELAVEFLSGGSAGSCRVGVYDNVAGTTVLYPGALLGQTEIAFAAAANGWQGAALPSPVTVTNGLCWLVTLFQVSKGVRWRAPWPAQATGWPAAGGGTPIAAITAPLAYAPLPATFPVGGSYVTSGDFPWVRFF